MAYHFENIKLEKGMYGRSSRSFSQALEELDPSEHYRGTPLEGLDAFQRQLKRFDIHVKGAGSDMVEKFFHTSDSAVLFPEFVSRVVRQGMEEESILPAITATLAKGISVNVTLIFSLERYEQVIDAYIEGIAQADANGHDLKHIGSVASFFVSRVDTAVDKLLEANGSDEAKALEGKAAVANARLAYELFEKKFAEDPRWADLAAKGAKVQRPLWASTGTKNAAYSDCKYVDELVAKHIVNTMPEKTLNALADHGNGAPSIKGTYEESHAIMAKLAELGIDFKAVTDKLEADGVASFIKSWDSVLSDVQSGIDRVNA